MKKVGYFFGVLLAVLAFVSTVHFCAHSAVASLAMMVPMLPRDFWGRPKLQRDISTSGGTWNVSGGAELRYPVYDRFKLLNSLGTNVRTLFKTAAGDQREGVTLTFADTNVQQSQQVPTSQKWVFDRLEVRYMASAARSDANIQSILDYFRTTYFGMKINSLDYIFILPLWKFFGSPQLISAPAVTVNSRFPQAQFTAIWDFSDVELTLEANTNWGIEVNPLVASAATLDNDFVGMEFGSKRYRLG